MAESGRKRGAGGRRELGRLRVLVANESRDRLGEVARIVDHIGQEVVAREVDVSAVAERAREMIPDVAVVGLHERHTDHALGMIEELVGEGVCPVVAVVEEQDPEFISRAAQSGIFAYISTLSAEAMRGAFDVALRRFGQAEELEGALARRAVIERAKGILMERYKIDERAAFGRLRDQSQRTGEKLVDVCQALLLSHALVSDQPRPEPSSP